MPKKRKQLQQQARLANGRHKKGPKGAPSLSGSGGRRRIGSGPAAAGRPNKLPSGRAGTTPPKGKPTPQQQQQKPVIPFSPDESILLVGEGDLSFARSLVEHHGCTNLTATVLEKDLAELLEKYPHVAENVEAVESSKGQNTVVFGVDARKMVPLVSKRPPQGGKPKDEAAPEEKDDEDEKEKENPPPSPPPQQQQQRNQTQNQPNRRNVSGRPLALKDRILFNFPHVGGKSTDVNRQVRYNQELLVDFFKRADRCLSPGGSIVVTLFEGEPYSLWNVRDLARHSGLQVERSFAFRADAYPGYHHARTLGVVRSKVTGELGGGWKGEDRPARSYIFYRKDEVPKPVAKKRKRSSSVSSDENQDEGGSEEDSDDGT